MTSLHSIFHRAVFALALLGTGVAGPQLLPAPAAGSRSACTVEPQAPAAAKERPAGTRKLAIALARSRAVLVAARE